MSKKILYIDMDGVVANFDAALNALIPDLRDPVKYPTIEMRSEKVDAVCSQNPNIFLNLELLPDAKISVQLLFGFYDLYFLSTPMWHVPQSFTDKRIWIENNFGPEAKQRLILTHRKDLCIGHYLVDDRTKHGASEFPGLHIHFGTPMFPDWAAVTGYLMANS